MPTSLSNQYNQFLWRDGNEVFVIDPGRGFTKIRDPQNLGIDVNSIPNIGNQSLQQFANAHDFIPRRVGETTAETSRQNLQRTLQDNPALQRPDYLSRTSAAMPPELEKYGIVLFKYGNQVNIAQQGKFGLGGGMGGATVTPQELSSLGIDINSIPDISDNPQPFFRQHGINYNTSLGTPQGQTLQGLLGQYRANEQSGHFDAQGRPAQPTQTGTPQPTTPDQRTTGQADFGGGRTQQQAITEAQRQSRELQTTGAVTPPAHLQQQFGSAPIQQQPDPRRLQAQVQDVQPATLQRPQTGDQQQSAFNLNDYIGTRPSQINPRVTEYFDKRTGQGYATPQQLFDAVYNRTGQRVTSFDQVTTLLSSRQQPGQPSQTPGQPSTQTPGQPTTQEAVQHALETLYGQGYVINPQAQITPQTVAEFMARAEREVEPYYASQLKLGRDSLLTSIGYQQQDLANFESEIAKKYESQFKQVGEQAAEVGFAQSGARAKDESELARVTQRNIDLNRQDIQRGAQNQAFQYAQRYGSSQLPQAPTLSAAPQVIPGQSQFRQQGRDLPFYNISDSVLSGIVGSQQQQRALDTRGLAQFYESQQRSRQTIPSYVPRTLPSPQ